MDRTAIIAIALAVGCLFWWESHSAKQQKLWLAAQKEAQIAAAAAAAKLGTPAPNAGVAPGTAAPHVAAPATTSAPLVPAAPSAPLVAEKLETLATVSGDYVFTNLGGGLKRVVLQHHKAEEGHQVTLNEFGTIPIGAVSEIAGEGTLVPYVSKMNAQEGVAFFEMTDARQLRSRKKFTLPRFDGLKYKDKLREEYLMWMDLEFTNMGTQPIQIPAYFVHTGSTSPLHHDDQPIYIGFDSFHGSSNKFTPVTWFAGWSFLGMFHGEAHSSYNLAKPDIRWGGVTNQYYTSLITPYVDYSAKLEVQAKQRANQSWARRFQISEDQWKNNGHRLEGKAEIWGVDGALGMPGITLAPGQTHTQTFSMFLGPREFGRLRLLGNYEAQILDFGWIGLVSETLLNSLNGLKRFCGDYGLAIILLTLIIKGLTWPLQNKAMESSKRMSLLAPEMKEIQEKYRENPERLQLETGKLFKKHKVNPLAGCIPALIQLPVFLGFYNMLGKAVELRNTSFLWATDLSQPDTVASFMGIDINPLPILMAATMLWTMAITPKTGDAQQQKIMMFMPLIFIVMCYNFASALALYWTVQNLFSVVQTYLTRNKVLPPEPAPLVLAKK